MSNLAADLTICDNEKIMAKNDEIIKFESGKAQPIERIENLILEIRGQQVMLDRDLARLYGVETRRLNEQVQRNAERFPSDFMFQLSKEEFEKWKSQNATSILDNDNRTSQNATSNSIKMGARKRPYAFTENGIAMLSGVLRSPQAIETNILIMRAFTAMRHFIGANAQMFQRMEIMERNQLAINTYLYDIDRKFEDSDHKFEEVFKRLDDRKNEIEKGILFDGQFFDAYTLIANLIKDAKVRIILFDNYIDYSVLNLLDKREIGVSATIYTKNIDAHLQADIDRHNLQYPVIDVLVFRKAHDRFLCIDDTVYLIGASIKDLGKKWCAFAKLEETTNDLLTRM